jgi:hypothetical protein
MEPENQIFHRSLFYFSRIMIFFNFNFFFLMYYGKIHNLNQRYLKLNHGLIENLISKKKVGKTQHTSRHFKKCTLKKFLSDSKAKNVLRIRN